MISAAYAWLRNSFDVRGRAAAVGRIVSGAVLRVFDRDHDPGEPRHPFDHVHRVDTGGLLYPDQLNSGHQNDMHSAGYYATAPSLFRGAVALWQATLDSTRHTTGDYTLIDIGCGKGRVLMLASEYPFRRIVGVELHPELAAVAQANLRRWLRREHRCRDVVAIHADALAAPISEGPVLLYLFNSFEQQMVISLLERLTEISRQRSAPIDLIYIHPEFDALVRQTPCMQLLADQDIAFSPEDSAADVFEVEVDRCSVYRLSGRLGV